MYTFHTNHLFFFKYYKAISCPIIIEFALLNRNFPTVLLLILIQFSNCPLLRFPELNRNVNFYVKILRKYVGK